jgi:hypothetical protein
MMYRKSSDIIKNLKFFKKKKCYKQFIEKYDDPVPGVDAMEYVHVCVSWSDMETSNTDDANGVFSWTV